VDYSLRRGQMCFNPLLVVQFSAWQLWRLLDLSSPLFCLGVECEMPMMVGFAHGTNPSRATLSSTVIEMRLWQPAKGGPLQLIAMT
jgi:hypothetical protein